MFCCYVLRKNPYEEHYDVIKVNEYMDLVTLAEVLDELMKRFAGMLTDIIIAMYLICVYYLNTVQTNNKFNVTSV